jgi:hypothetical protein
MTCSIGVLVALESVKGMPSSRAAEAVATSQSLCSCACTPMGETTSGVGKRRPKSVTLESNCARSTPASMRGTAAGRG